MTADQTRAAPLGELEIARAVRQTVVAQPGVRELMTNLIGGAATYGPGEMVRGVAVRQDAGVITLEVRIVAEYNPALPLPALADQLRAILRTVVAALTGQTVGRIDIGIDDLALPDGEGGPR